MLQKCKQGPPLPDIKKEYTMRKLTTLIVSGTFMISLNAMANESTINESTVNEATATVTVPPALVSEVVSAGQINEHIKSSIQQHWHQTKAELTESAKAQLKETIQATINAAKNLL